MSLWKMRYYLAGLVALLVGMPLTDKVFAVTGADDIADASANLASTIASLSGLGS